MSEKIIKTIKQRGYWRVIIRPAQQFYNKERIENSKLVDIIDNARVSLRGLDYPHMDRSNIKPISQSIISGEGDFGDDIEYWEFMTSGQFVHIFSMQEDYIIDEQQANKIKSRFLLNANKVKNINKFFEVSWAVYRFTEIYLFASNLAQLNEFRDVDEFEIITELHNVKERVLFFWQSGRDLREPYICYSNSNKISFKEQYKKDDLIAKFDFLAMDVIIKTFNSFGWWHPNRQMLCGDQKKLLERRL